MVKKILNFLIYITIFSLPFYIVKTTIFRIPVTLLEILVLVTFGVWVTNIFKERAFGQLKRCFNWPIVALLLMFLFAGLLSVFVSSDRIAALGVFKAYIIEPILFFVVVIDTVYEKKQKDGIFYSLVTSGIFVSLIALSQKITGTNVYAPHEILQGRVTGVFNSANSLSLFLGPIICLVFAKVFFMVKKSRQEKVGLDIHRQIFWLSVVLVLYLIVIYLTQSLGGMLGIIVAVTVMLGIQSSKFKIQNWEKKDVFFGVVWYFVVQLVFFMFVSNWTPKLEERPLTRVYDNTFTIRLCLWEGTTNMLRDNFVLGAGLSSFPQKYEGYVTCDPELLQYPHNLILNFWSEMGIFGLISFLGLIIVYLNNSLKGNNLTGWQVGLLGILIYYLVHGLVDVPYFKNDLSMMWLLFLAMTIVQSSSDSPEL